VDRSERFFNAQADMPLVAGLDAKALESLGLRAKIFLSQNEFINAG
jgi:Mlc titration factor MtfA (ptsG expression regulator)